MLVLDRFLHTAGIMPPLTPGRIVSDRHDIVAPIPIHYAEVRRMATVSTIAVLALVVGGLSLTFVRTTRDEQRRKEYLSTVRAIRWWMVPMGLLQLTLVLGAALGLTLLIPQLWWSWWRLFGGVGNIAFGQTDQPGLGWTIVGVIIPISVTLLVPALAYNEELAFRLDSEDETRVAGLIRQLKFGLMHSAFAGVPIAAGLALTISGIYYRQVYLVRLRRHTPTETAGRTAPDEDAVLPPLPIGKPYDAAEWDEVLALRSRTRTATAQARLLNETDPDEVIDGPQRDAIVAAAAAHTVSNWMVCVLLLGVLLMDSLP